MFLQSLFVNVCLVEMLEVILLGLLADNICLCSVRECTIPRQKSGIYLPENSPAYISININLVLNVFS